MPRMLEEILNTRVMVKKSMKLHKDDKVPLLVCNKCNGWNSIVALLLAFF